jgi:anaerobic C4-dicarboxylate transporter DcuB
LTASPVSAPMAAMVGLLTPLGFQLNDILLIVWPPSVLAMLIGGVVMNRVGVELADDPEYRRRLAVGEVEPLPQPGGHAHATAGASPAGARRAALIFLGGLAVVVLAGVFAPLHPVVTIAGRSEPIAMPQFIEMTMLATAALIVMLCRVRAAEIQRSSLFTSGLSAVVALFGVAWMANTFIAANEAGIIGGLGAQAQRLPLLIGAALFAVAGLTTSQTSATISIIPIGVALGIPPQYLAAMWPAVVGAFLFPTNGQQIATVEIDQTGTTHIGRFVVNHSFIIPVAVFTVVTVGLGFAIAGLW